jgi:virginiamycin B lyase
MTKRILLLFCILVACSISAFAQSTWQQIPGALTWVSVAQDGTVWGVNSSDNIFRWTGNGWQQVPGALKQISVGNTTNVWGVNSADNIFKLMF